MWRIHLSYVCDINLFGGGRIEAERISGGGEVVCK